MLAGYPHDGLETARHLPGFGEAGGTLECHPGVLEELRRVDEALQLVGDAPGVGERFDPDVLVQRDLVLPGLFELQRRSARRGRPHVGDRARAPGLLLDPGPDARRLRRISPALRRFRRAGGVAEREEELDRTLHVSGLGKADGGLARELLLVVVEPADERGPDAERLHHQVPGVRVPLHRGERPRGVRDAPRAKVGPHSRIDLPFLLERARGREHLVAGVIAHASSGSPRSRVEHVGVVRDLERLFGER